MHSSYLLVALFSTSASAIPLPLNINLGAYSPALVVGDGEISFGGNQDVSNLMSALEGAAVSGATANNGGTTSKAAAAVTQVPAANDQSVAVVPTAAATPVPENQNTQIASLQGMGKEIAPRVVKLEKKDGAALHQVAARDMATLTAALNYASTSLKSGPEVDLGTGKGGSGVGIIVKAGGTGNAANAAAKLAKREAPEPKLKTTVTTMFIRGGSIQDATEAVAEPRTLAEATEAAQKQKRSPSVSPGSSSEIDGVNLNMAEGQVAELTFVETTKEPDAE